MKKWILVSSLLVFSTWVQGAALHSLTKEQITDMISNHTLTTIPMTTLNGDVQNMTFSGYWSKDGKITGQFSAKPEHDPQKDEGKWMVKKDGSLCYTWTHWNNSKQVCVATYKTKNALIFVNAAGKFESAVLLDDIKGGNQLS